MSRKIFTGWRTVIPGKCFDCGEDDMWYCDGRGSILCACQACPDCGILDAYGFHEDGCPQIEDRRGACRPEQNCERNSTG